MADETFPPSLPKGFDFDALINNPQFQMGLGLMGAANPRNQGLMQAYQILNSNTQFQQQKKIQEQKMKLEEEHARLYGQQVEQSKARTAAMERETAQKNAQFDMGMKFLRQLYPDIAEGVQPTVQVPTAPGQPPAAVPGPVNPGAAKPVMDTGKHGTPKLILDNLMQVESGGNPFAIGPPIEGSNERALGPFQFRPSTIKMLKQEGISFNPFDVAQSRDAADYLLQKNLKANGGDWNKAIAAYGGFVTKDPSDYIKKVMAGSPEKQAAQHLERQNATARLAQLEQQSAAAKKQQQAAGVLRFMFGDPAGISEAAKATAPDYEGEKLRLEAGRLDVSQGELAESQKRTGIQQQQANTAQQNADTQKSEEARKAERAKQDRTGELAKLQKSHDTISNAMQHAEKQIDQLLNDKGLQGITGKAAMTNFLAIPGSDAYGALAKLKSIQSKLINDTLQAVRQGSSSGASGYGQFTEKELEVIKTYLDNLDPGRPDFREALEGVKTRLGEIRAQSGRYLEQATGGEIKDLRVVRTGKSKDGRRVEQMSDGSIRYAD